MDGEDAEITVWVHDTVNEASWKQVLKWEAFHT